METSLHSLLRRQLRRHVGNPDTVPPAWQAFIDAVNQAYRQSDVDRLMIERSLDLSSEELGTANAHMREAVQALQRAHLDLESRVADRTSVADTCAPSRRAVAIACKPATPTPMIKALAAEIVPAAVIIIGKARP